MNPKERRYNRILLTGLFVISLITSACGGGPSTEAYSPPLTTQPTVEISTRAFCEDSNPAIDVSVTTSLPNETGLLLAVGYADTYFKPAKYATSDTSNMEVKVTGTGSHFSEEHTQPLRQNRDVKIKVYAKSDDYLSQRPLGQVIVKTPICN